MRTGAIFARGSCRALKGTALLGAVLVLGAGQAVAQDTTAPTLASAMFEPGAKAITVTASEPVYGSPDKGDFTVTGSTVTSISMASSSGSPSMTFTINVMEAIETGSTPGLTYEQPDAEGKQIKDAAGNALEDATTAVTVAEKDVAPMLGEVDDRKLPQNKRVSPISLPEGTGGNGDLTYSLLLVSSDNDDVTDNTEITTTEDAGTGLSFLADPPTILGTPTAMGTHSFRYTVTDGDGTGNTLSNPESASQDFDIMVEGEDYTPTDGLDVTVKSVAAAGTVAEGGVLDVTVTAKIPEGKGKIPSRMVMVSFHNDNDKIMMSERAELGEEFDLINPDGDMYYEWEDIPLKEKASEATFKFRVEINRDVDAEDEKFQIGVKINDEKAVRTKDVLMVDDAETQKYTLSLPSAAKGAITEGAEDATKLTLKADPERTMNIPVSMALNPNDPAKYSLTFDATEFGMAPATVTATIKAMADKNRTEDTITVTAYTDGSLGNKMELASLNIKVKDANPLPGVRAKLVDEDGKALDPQPKSATEGDTLMVMLTAVDEDGDSMTAAEDLSIRLMPAGTAGVQDYRLSSNPIEIASGKKSSAAVDLMVLADEDVDDGEMLTFDAVVSGDEKVGPGSNSVMGVLSLTIMDGTTKLVWAKTQEEVEKAIYDAKAKGAGDDETFSPGEMMEVMGNALFSSAEGVTLAYTAATDSDAVGTSTSGATVSVTAMKAGMAHVTITAHATGPNGVKILPQSEPDEASIMFPVEVGLEALTLELMGPGDDMRHIVEGGMAHANGTPGSAMITVKANRAVTEAVTVNLMIDRTMSGPGLTADDFELEAITIAAGMDTGSTTLTAVSDDMDERMEELVLFGQAEDNAGMVSGEVKLYIWDAAVPALPIIAQLLLGGLLVVGGYRRYRRR